MKFGKRLAAEAARCWPEACLDYKAIKRALKHDLACKGEQQCAGRVAAASQSAYSAASGLGASDQLVAAGQWRAGQHHQPFIGMFLEY
jgi:hypothetical protein